MSDRHLVDAQPGESPRHEDVQQLVEAERGLGVQGVRRTWQASNSARVVLTSDASGVRISADDGTTAPSQVLVASMLDTLIPPGTIWAYAGLVAPTGWVLCNGSLVPTATYPKLFAAIGYTYGGAGATFAVPDLRGRVPLGLGGAHGLASTGGSETAPGPTHTHPGSHSHGLNSHTHAGAGHTHSMQSHVHGLNGHAHTLNGHQHSVDLAHGHTGSTGALTGVVQRVVVGTAADPNHPNDAHGHAVTVTALGTTSTTVAASGTANTGTDSSNSGVPSATDTGGATAAATGVPSPTTDTATDASAPASSYGAVTVPTMMPFQTVQWMIKTGA